MRSTVGGKKMSARCDDSTTLNAYGLIRCYCQEKARRDKQAFSVMCVCFYWVMLENVTQAGKSERLHSCIRECYEERIVVKKTIDTSVPQSRQVWILCFNITRTSIFETFYGTTVYAQSTHSLIILLTWNFLFIVPTEVKKMKGLLEPRKIRVTVLQICLEWKDRCLYAAVQENKPHQSSWVSIAVLCNIKTMFKKKKKLRYFRMFCVSTE